MKRVLVLAGLALASCSDPAMVDGQLEIAGELRALRVAMQEGATTTAAPGPAPAAATFDRAELTQAMEPLREVVVGLMRDMEGMQNRQTALTQELKRWSQLLVQSTTAGTQEDASALVTRLEELEKQMSQQDTRHREVEDLLIRALDSTSGRLESFLERLGEINTPAGATPPAKKINDNDNSNAGNNSSGTPDGSKSGERIGAARRGSARSPSMWWYGVAAVALVAGGLFAFWLGRENRAGNATLAPTKPLAADDGEGVQELWAAAALLGEAVGRLRETDPEGELADVPGTTPENRADLDIDDLFVIDDEPAEAGVEVEADGPTFAEPVADPVAEPVAEPPAAEMPVRQLLRLSTTNPAQSTERALATLGDDPRVLRRPEPAVTLRAGMLEVEFSVLPQLPSSERAHIELAVRDVVR